MIIKAHKVKKLKMKWAFEEGEISKEEYNKFLQNYSIIDTALDSKLVFFID